MDKETEVSQDEDDNLWIIYVILLIFVLPLFAFAVNYYDTFSNLISTLMPIVILLVIAISCRILFECLDHLIKIIK